MMGNGLKGGVVLCSVYDDTNKPPAGDIEIHAQGHINIFADENMKLTGSRIDLN